MILSSEEQIFKHLATNYWDNYIDSVEVFSKDTSLIGGVTKESFNTAYIEYVSILQRVPEETYIKAQKKLLKLIDKTQKQDTNSRVFESVVSITDLALYGVNSELRNEELYIPFLEDLVNSPALDATLRDKYIQDLEDCKLNRIGTIANNFTLHTKDGKVRSLHKIKADYTFLFFSNPGCKACFEIINTIKNSPKISDMIKSKSLTVLNMFIDQDLTEWFEYMPIYPKEWINAYDQESLIKNDHLYDVRAIPSIYLLDQEKRVIYKDAHYPIVINYLENLN